MKLITTTYANNDTAKQLIHDLVQTKRLACVQTLTIHSQYWWQGTLTHAEELLVIGKAPDHRVDEICNHIEAHHPYDTPEILVFTPEKVNAAYSQWVDRVTQSI